LTPYPLANVLIVVFITAALLWLFGLYIPAEKPESQKAKGIVCVVVCVILAIWIIIYLLGGFARFG
jgi:hypothetical protein